MRVTAGDRITMPAPAPLDRRRADPEAWRLAVGLVEKDGDGDRRRLQVLADGSVSVRNRPARI